MSKKKSCIQSQGLTVEFLEEITMLLKMIAHPHRLKIIEIIERDEEVNVSSIVDEIQIPQSSVSIHLNQMKRMGLLKSSRSGREVRYRIDNPHVFRLLECICRSYHEECND
ncbi:MAG: metalloregulator ArsR/SmtB family transcription factor [Kiritimatiellia bacterium]